jgi:hypothetical protein
VFIVPNNRNNKGTVVSFYIIFLCAFVTGSKIARRIRNPRDARERPNKYSKIQSKQPLS